MKFGITEYADAGLDLSWYNKLDKVGASILITKNINDLFIETVAKAHNEGHKIIVHITCTGLGHTKLEPCVPTKEWTYSQAIKLLEVFPSEQIVLRVDPMIPTKVGIQHAEAVLMIFNDLPIKRVRYSFLDMYNHVIGRFTEKGFRLPYSTFNAPYQMQADCLNMLSKYSNRYEFESCAENTVHKLGCISHKDFDILGIDKSLMKGKCKQRATCSCVGNKFQLLAKPKGGCPHKCLYCFWK